MPEPDQTTPVVHRADNLWHGTLMDADRKTDRLMVRKTLSDLWHAFVRWHKVVLAVAIACAAGGYVWKNQQEFAKLRNFEWQFVPGLVLSAIVLLMVNGFIARQMIAAFGVMQRPVEWFGLSVVNAMGNYLKPLPVGAVARGVYLNRVRGLSYTDYSVTLLANYFVQVVAAAICGGAAIGWLILGMQAQVPSWLWLVLVVLIVGLPLLAMLLPRLGWLRIGRFGPVFMEAWEVFWGNRRMLGEVLLLQLVFVTTSAWGLWLAYRSIGLDMPFQAALFFSVLPIITQVYSVLPGGFGIREFSAGISAYVLGRNPNDAAAAMFIVGLVTVVTVLLLGGVFGHRLSRSFSLASRPAEITEGVS